VSLLLISCVEDLGVVGVYDEQQGLCYPTFRKKPAALLLWIMETVNYLNFEGKSITLLSVVRDQ